MFKDQQSLYYDLIIIHMIIAYVHELYYKHHTRMMTERIDVVVNCTSICVNNKSKLTNSMNISRIEGYNGKSRSNPWGSKGFLRDLLEFDQIG